MKNINSSDCVKMFQLEDFPFLISDLVSKHYVPLEVIGIQIHQTWKTYLPVRIYENTLHEGVELFGDQNRFDAYKNEYEKYKNISVTFFKEVLSRNDLSRDVVQQYLQLIAEEWKYYSKTEFFYVDDAYKLSERNKIIAKNLKQLESIKSKGREHINSLIFGNNSYLYRLLTILSVKFEIHLDKILQYSTEEIVDLFDGKKVAESIIDERNHAYAFNAQGKILNMMEGKTAENFAKEFMIEDDNLILKGVIANKGRVTGRARVLVYKVKDFDNLSHLIEEMEQDEILVADTTSPGIVAACKKAKAIVANQGGLLSHAAIISRELKIPCIVGLKDVTERIKTGDMVEVDANTGIIKILK